MNALIISDSHGNVNFLESVISAAKNCCEIEQIWHLGDEYEDMDYVDFEGIVKRVPGTRHPGYYSGAIPKFLSFSFGGAEISMVHSPYDIPKFMIGQKRLFFYGHLHCPSIAQSGNGILLSPGHVKHDFDRGHEASFIIAEFSGSKDIKIGFYSRFGELCEQASIEDLGENYKLQM